VDAVIKQILCGMLTRSKTSDEAAPGKGDAAWKRRVSEEKRKDELLQSAADPPVVGICGRWPAGGKRYP
jgi:hypothetical protein